MAINNDWSLGLSGNPKAVADKTATSITPKKFRSLSFPLNEIVGDCVGSRSSAPAIIGGAIDAGLFLGAKNPKIDAIKIALGLLNDVPRGIYGDDVWKDICKNGKKEIDNLGENLNSQVNQLTTPPIPYVDY